MLYGLNFAEQQEKKYHVRINVTENDFLECEDLVDMQCVVIDRVYEAREKRYKDAPKSQVSLSIMTNATATEWVCEINGEKLVGVFSGERGFSRDDVKQLAEIINALLYMEYTVNADVINRLMQEMYSELDWDCEHRYLLIEETALEYLGVA